MKRYILFSLLIPFLCFCEKPQESFGGENTDPEEPVAVPLTESECEPWQSFVGKKEDNVPPDFSFAGYRHGESAPADVSTLGYRIYNVCDYGAVPDDGKSDREAFLLCLEDALGVKRVASATRVLLDGSENAGVVIFFPKGDYILHSVEDDVDGVSQTINIVAGHFVLKGAGMGKTRLIMAALGTPKDQSQVWNGIPMLSLGRVSGITSEYPVAVKAEEDSPKGVFFVKVNLTSGIAPGDWVCVSALVKDMEYAAREVAPLALEPRWNIATNGVQIQEYHQVEKVSGNEIVFKEPLMHSVDAKYGFSIKRYNALEEVGVEDLTLAGKTDAGYTHLRSWQDDSGYQTLFTYALANSWVRRVGCESVTIGVNVSYSANCSCYQMENSGIRGHIFVRSASSTRIFIGATKDGAKGKCAAGNPVYPMNATLEDCGQFHGQGVAQLSIGAVLWRNTWGRDACFEAHATQSRASLFDSCQGGWIIYRQGGGYTSMPNHLDDLIIWNMNAWNSNRDYFTWFLEGEKSLKFLPPVIVGFLGGKCRFNPEQVKLDYNNGAPVEPESLYEGQLRLRLGYVPEWLNELKSTL